MKNIESTAVGQALARIDKNELLSYYADHSRTDTCDHFAISACTLANLLKRFNFKKTKEQKRQALINSYGSVQDFYTKVKAKTRQTIIERYGSLDAFEDEKVRRARETVLQKYGDTETYLAYRTERQRLAYLEKYGVENISQLEAVKQKKKASMVEHFGSLENAYKERQKKTNKTWIANYGSLENYRTAQQELSKQTVLAKYGVENILLSDEIQAKARNTCKQRYGVECACMLNICRGSARGLNNSKPNQQFAERLLEAGIKYDEKEYPLGRFIYDFKVGNLLFEVNPTATHNVTWSPFGDHSGLSIDYHQLKSINAYEHGYRCVHIFDWTDTSLVINNIKNAKYQVIEQTFGVPNLYIYNLRSKQLVECLSDNCVEIYDDGIILEEGTF
jgi:hypothetical protein